ncbi:uncharacterized protein EI90DRAFT_3117309 [Cantharellus anzutake]|uniref:uncharacterized protein n=1 Tax=Cantharellus anzutake TaxID=1750568 RepID=UPI001905E271|nr:uncharacterized protein EI90DRAFT_3117309 [Cantharellus anzutake]KAF8340756.1 hypothetical protein EI90DRAFT_3117309 [Cantharellus anzutake]
MLTLRPAGFSIFDTIITLQILKRHLHQNEMSFTTNWALLNPADKQDIPKAIELLKAIWDLPLITNNKDPIWTAQRYALHLFGRVCFWFVQLYIDITLSLQQQLGHLSAAAQLLLILFQENPNKGQFMPTQLYIDIQIAIKNLSTRLLHVTEIQNILAHHPEWDRSPQHLRLPSLQELEKESQHIDHITPGLWKGREDDVRDATAISLLGSNMDAPEIEAGMISGAEDMVMNPIGDGPNAGLDLEDILGAITNDYRVPLPYLSIHDEKTGEEKTIHKAQALKALFQSIVHQKGSLDQQKQIAGLTQFSVTPTGTISDIDANDTIFGDSICIGDPAVTLINVENIPFLAVVQISALKIDGQGTQAIPLTVLSEHVVKVSFHILTLKVRQSVRVTRIGYGRTGN